MYKKSDQTCGIYAISSPSGNYYIGSTSCFYKRFWEHKRALKNKNHVNPILQNAYNKYQKELKFETLFVCCESDLLYYEQILMNRLRPEYNIALFADSPMRGRTTSAETRKKLSLAHLGRRVSAETREKIRLAKTGKPLSEAHKKAISETLKLKYVA